MERTNIWIASGVAAGAVATLVIALPIDQTVAVQLSIPIAFVATRWGLGRGRRPVPDSFWESRKER